MTELYALTIDPGATRTPQTDPVIYALDPYFEEAGIRAVVTSILRTTAQQLAVIERYARSEGLVTHALDMTTLTWYEGKQYPLWQVMWSHLLTRGLIINPPAPAVVLTDYWRAGVNRRGLTIPASPHTSGRAFDIGGGTNGAADEYAVVQLAARDIPAIAQIVLERANNCTHVTVRA